MQLTPNVMGHPQQTPPQPRQTQLNPQFNPHKTMGCTPPTLLRNNNLQVYQAKEPSSSYSSHYHPDTNASTRLRPPYSKIVEAPRTYNDLPVKEVKSCHTTPYVAPSEQSSVITTTTTELKPLDKSSNSDCQVDSSAKPSRKRGASSEVFLSPELYNHTGKLPKLSSPIDDLQPVSADYEADYLVMPDNLDTNDDTIWFSGKNQTTPTFDDDYMGAVNSAFVDSLCQEFSPSDFYNGATSTPIHKTQNLAPPTNQGTINIGPPTPSPPVTMPLIATPPGDLHLLITPPGDKSPTIPVIPKSKNFTDKTDHSSPIHEVINPYTECIGKDSDLCSDQIASIPSSLCQRTESQCSAAALPRINNIYTAFSFNEMY